MLAVPLGLQTFNCEITEGSDDAGSAESDQPVSFGSLSLPCHKRTLKHGKKNRQEREDHGMKRGTMDGTGERERQGWGGMT